METLSNLALGFSVAFSPINIAYCFLGVTIGTAIGVLPGLGPAVTIAVLLPITFGLPPDAAIIMLSGIYYGAQYGGSTTSILVNLPGETSSVVTCIDGHQMAKKGRAGAALTTAALASFFAGTVGTLLMALFAPALAGIALDFRSPEYFSLGLFAITMTASLVQGSMIKGLLVAILGILFGIVGVDSNSGEPRFTFGLFELSEGLEFSVAAIGLFAFTETILQLTRTNDQSEPPMSRGSLMLTREEMAASWKPAIRGTAIGSFFGILPGAGASISAYASYSAEKRLSKSPERFGRGAIEGVAGPEAANNAAAQASFIPTLTLGVPGSVTMAFMLAALMIQNIQPGPEVITRRPDLFWGLVVSMWLGNLLLVVLNLPLVGIWVAMLKIPYRLFFPAILVFSCVGALSINNSSFDVLMIAMFCAIGYVLLKLDFELAPFALGFILGPMLEQNLRRSMLLSRGDPSIFITEPISCVFIVLAFAMAVWMIVSSLRKSPARSSTNPDAASV